MTPAAGSAAQPKPNYRRDTGMLMIIGSIIVLAVIIPGWIMLAAAMSARGTHKKGS